VILDVFVESANLAVEYHGIQHFFDVNTLNESVIQTDRDAVKAVTCARRGIALVEVPYWWDLTLTSGQAFQAFKTSVDPLIQAK